MKQSFRQAIAILTATSLFVQNLMPIRVFASGGPVQPEFSNFESVGTNAMVNEFTGDFTYNLPVLDVPGPEGGGYALSLSYHSGMAPDEDASWVGYGWTLSPGAIVRNKRGFADDVKAGSITRYNENTENNIWPDNFTFTVGGDVSIGAGKEVLGIKLGSVSAGQNYQLTYNNHVGFFIADVPYANCSALGVSAGMQYNRGSLTFNAGFTPTDLIETACYAMKKNQQAMEHSKAANSWGTAGSVLKSYGKSMRGISTSNQAYTLGGHSFPTINQSVSGKSYSFIMKVEPTAGPLPATVLEGDLYGSYSYQNFNTSSSATYYGYMYSDQAYSNDDAVMDYSVEKDMPYNIRDKYLGIPYSNADMFTVMGNGVGGTFRPFSKYVGYFRPNKLSSHTDMYRIGVDGLLGVDNGMGAHIGILDNVTAAAQCVSMKPSSSGAGLKSGTNDLTIKGWNNAGYQYGNSVDESWYMAFLGDQGGSADFNNDNAQAAALTASGSISGFKSYTPTLSTTPSLDTRVNVTHSNTETNRVARSSYVGYHTNGEMAQTDGGGNLYKRYSKRLDNEITGGSTIIRSNSDLIGEFCVTNNSSQQYIYALPVHNTSEINYSYDAEGATKAGGGNYDNTDHIVFKNVNATGYTKRLGEQNNSRYASSWLLTEIHSPNYIDRTNDGPTNDDFGGWTKFNYLTGYSVKYRYPYRGFYLNTGNLSDKNDDMISYNAGVRESYYLSSIETKTHIAVFTYTSRADGFDAPDDENADNSNTTTTGCNSRFKKLDRIDLYVKDGNNTNLSDNIKIKTVRFSYDYSLQAGIPNFNTSTSTGDPNYTSSLGTGKLTLKKVWFEYAGITNATISPYLFEYSYPASTYPSPYCSTCGSTSMMPTSGLTQNPNYNAANTDRWGNYREDGTTRDQSLNPWLDQTTSSTFDPAAWHLKQISLPTGGRIDIQYEQKEYAYVQDKKAMVMVKLQSSSSVTGTDSDKYYLDLNSDLGYDNTKWTSYVSILQKKFIDGENGKEPEKMYFKFLYNIMEASSSGLTDCDAQYITGYANVKEVGQDASGVWIKLGNSAADGSQVPHRICFNYYLTNRQGQINSSCSAYSEPFDLSSGIDLTSQIYSLLSGGNVFITAVTDEATKCRSVNETLSYLRVPVIDAKKGGGVRVKRILMYDSGIETSDAALYGTEYVYQNQDGTSSGVATNEPSFGEEENALIGYISEREEQSFAQTLIAGRDKDQFEGPIGNEVLPAPSIGYSRIIAKNIHSGTTNNGFSVSEYYTAKDFPSTYGMQVTAMNKKVDQNQVINFLSPLVKFCTWATQGYTFVINNMHGQAKKMATYSGDYANINDVNKTHCSASTEYSYYTPGEQVKTVRNWNWKAGGNITDYEMSCPGKQAEVVTESKAIVDSTATLELQIDFSIGYAGVTPLPYLTLVPYGSLDISKLYSHVTTKIINYPARVKSVRTTHDGVCSIANNEYFDSRTGQAISISTNDEYANLKTAGSSTAHNGQYYNYNFPADHYYDRLQQKSLTEKMTLGGTSDCSITKNNGYLLVSGADACGCAKYFTKGDLISVSGGTLPSTEVYNVAYVNGNYIGLTNNSNFYNSTSTSDNVSVTILESGKKNILSANAGSVTSYGGQPGVTVYDITSTDRANRITAVAAVLNTNIPASGSYSSGNFPTSYGITVINSAGSCVAMNYPYMLDRRVGNNQMLVTINNCNTSVTYNSSYSFFISNSTGELMYGSTSDQACATSFGNCIDFCPDPYTTLTKIVSAGATQLHDSWSLSGTNVNSVYFPGSTAENDFQKGAKNVNTKTAYGYKTNRSNITSSTSYNYDVGIFNDFTVFNWKSPYNNSSSQWIATDTVRMYAPNGSPLETQNALSMKGLTKYLTKSSTSPYFAATQLPYLVASNSAYDDCFFEGFEGGSLSCEDGWTVGTTYGSDTYSHSNSSTYCHSGSKSLQLGNVNVGSGELGYVRSYLTLKSFAYNQQMKDNGIIVKFWLKVTGSSNDPNTLTLYIDHPTNSSYNQSASFSKVARVGEWTLYQASMSSTNFSNFSTSSISSLTPYIYVRGASGQMSTVYYVDDIRYQPSNAQATAFIYDLTNMRLTAQFDDQNFGLFYQYDAEGKLIRKQVETTNGFKTVTETQYNVPSVAR